MASEIVNEAMHHLIQGDELGFRSKLADLVGGDESDMLPQLYERSMELGRQSFTKSEFAAAVEYFTAALSIAPTEQAKSAIFSNRAACYLKMNRADDSLNEARKSIAANPVWPKSWYRAGRALADLSELQSAIRVLEYGLTLATADPEGGKDIEALLNTVKVQYNHVSSLSVDHEIDR